LASVTVVPEDPRREGGCRPPTRDALDRLFLGNGTLARTLARPGICARALPANWQAAPVSHAAVAADFHQPLDVHRNLFPEVAFDSALFLDDAADLPHIVFREILDPNIGAHPGFFENRVRAYAADAVNVGQSHLDPLGAGKVDACDACHIFSPSPFEPVIPDAVCVFDSGKSPAPRRGGVRSCTCRKSVEPMLEPS